MVVVVMVMVSQISHQSMIVENVLKLVASQSCGHNVAGAKPCSPFNKAMSTECTSLIFAPDIEQLNHSEAAESFSACATEAASQTFKYNGGIILYSGSQYMPTHADIYVLQ